MLLLLQLALFVANLNSENLAMEMDINANIKRFLKKLRGLEGEGGGGYIRKQNIKDRKKRKKPKRKNILNKKNIKKEGSN